MILRLDIQCVDANRDRRAKPTTMTDGAREEEGISRRFEFGNCGDEEALITSRIKSCCR